MDEDGPRADYSLLLPAPQAGCRQGAVVAALKRALRFICMDDAEYAIITHPESLPLRWKTGSSASIR